MSASSSMTRTEIVPLRMPRPTVLGTPRQIGYLSGEARERAGTAAAGVPPSACSRMTPTDGGPCLSGVALSPYPSRSPSYRSAPVPRRGRSCPGRPPPGDLHRVVMTSRCCEVNGGGAMVQDRRFHVAVRLLGRNLSAGRAGGPVPPAEARRHGDRRVRRGPPERPPGPAPITGPVMGSRGPPVEGRDEKSPSVTKSADAGDRVSLSMPSRLKDPI